MMSLTCSARVRLSRALLGCIAAALAHNAEADSNLFLGIRGEQISGKGGLLEQLEVSVGREHRLAAEKRVSRLEEAMRSAFASIPKDGDGRLDSAGVRYLLHRLFVQRHGWFVDRLGHDGDAWNASSPVAAFAKGAESHHDIFQEKLSSHGFSLHDVAVFAATLEALVHSENVERLQAVYRMLELPQSGVLQEEQGLNVLTSYMALYEKYTHQNYSVLTQRELYALTQSRFSSFPERLKFAKGVRQRVLEDTDDGERNSWNSMLNVVEEIGERYGRWQDTSCRELKGKLLEMEKPGTGRVRLEDFYGSLLHNNTWQFGESVPFLRDLGALDESDPQSAAVIIPNYLNSPANCVGTTSHFYTICCIDECEALLGNLEEQVAAPHASPARIAEIVEALPSDTIEAPHKLPTSLTSRLEEIAAHHGGSVPLHGRLFAQWMHHAYPRECPYPHTSGATKPMIAKAWQAYSGKKAIATKAEALRVATDRAVLASPAEEDELQALPWSTEEELFVCSANGHGCNLFETKGAGAASQSLLLFMVPVSALLMVLKWYVQEAILNMDNIGSKQHYV